MGLANRRRTMGYSQEKLAHLLGVDRTTVGRWECGKVLPQPQQRKGLASALGLSPDELDCLLAAPAVRVQENARCQTEESPTPGDSDEMIRRAFLRALSVSGALAVLPVDEAEALQEGAGLGASADFDRMNGHLWQVYQLARSKRAMHPVIRDQLTTLNEALASGREPTRPLLSAAADLFQLAGEVAFDGNRYSEAASSYALAASVGRDADAYDLWACALVRHAYVEMSEGRHRHAVQLLGAAARLARRGDSALSTRQWVASVQAEAYAGLGDLTACERAMDQAETVCELGGGSANGGWLRFDGTRLSEERGARYVQLGRFDLAEETLTRALKQTELAAGHSYRRRGAVLTDLAVIGVRRGDAEQVVAYGGEAVGLARVTGSGYVVRRLGALRGELGSLGEDRRVAGLAAEIAVLGRS
ncbi:transcriptional regulator [Streptomyces koyangensis]|uniref:Helix-turn-helix domain-containing protein n=1 Tax=Streptomyces koyangensis TaxID=188770 RepID=A0ABX7EDS6_9ACTN|nr:transcriptional regulator [Streptomyces koyangensis]QRF01920.1 helix-turn-helix domain-containing protein [Streptomyces koyangensis]